jgi:AcrR family transcriptional regulator
MAAKQMKDSAILAAAQQEFLKRGYRHTSIETIAQAAGIAKGTVYLYFESKEDVFRAVSKQFISWFLGKAKEAAKSEGSVTERVTRVLEAKFGAVHAMTSRSPHGAELIDSSHGVSGELYREADKAYVKILAGVLKELELTMSSNEAAWLLFRSAQGVEFTVEREVTANEVSKRLRQLSEVCVRGVTR